METSAEDSGDKNKITVKFDAMMIPLPEVIVSNKMNESLFLKDKGQKCLLFLDRYQILCISGDRIQQ